MFTRDTNDYAIIQSLADVVEDDPLIKEKFDQAGEEIQTYINDTLLAELESTTEGDSGADNIGFQSNTVSGSTVKAAIEDNRAAIVDVVLSQVPNNSLTEAKMAAEMKKQAGGVYPYDDGAQNAADIATNVLSIEANAEAIDVLEDHHVYYTTTGSANAYVLTTTELFDFSKNGSLRVNPSFTNTGASTISVNGTTKNIKKFDIDSDAYVSVEADDIKKNNQVELRYSVSDGFFVLAPKGGGIKFASGVATNTGEFYTVNNLSFTPTKVFITELKSGVIYYLFALSSESDLYKDNSGGFTDDLRASESGISSGDSSNQIIANGFTIQAFNATRLEWWAIEEN